MTSQPTQNNNAPGAGGTPGGPPARTPADAYSQPITPIETLLQKETNPLSVPRQQEAFRRQLLHSVRAKRIQQGFDFTATLTPGQPAPGPAPAPAAAATGAAGGPGGPGGMRNG